VSAPSATKYIQWMQTAAMDVLQYFLLAHKVSVARMSYAADLHPHEESGLDDVS